MALEHPVSSPPPTAGTATATVSRPIRRAIALPLHDDDLGGAAASALISSTQAARAAGSAVTAPATGAVSTLSGGTTRGRFGRTIAGRASATATPQNSVQPGSTLAGRLFRPDVWRQQQAVDAGNEPGAPGTISAAAEAGNGEAHLTGALAEAVAEERPRAARAVAGHGAKLGRWPLMAAAAVAGAVLVSVPFVHNNDKELTNYEGLDNPVPLASLDDADGSTPQPNGYASDMPIQDPADGPATPLVPEPEPGTQPVLTAPGTVNPSAGGDGTALVPGTGATPGSTGDQGPLVSTGEPGTVLDTVPFDLSDPTDSGAQPGSPGDEGWSPGTPSTSDGRSGSDDAGSALTPKQDPNPLPVLSFAAPAPKTTTTGPTATGPTTSERSTSGPSEAASAAPKTSTPAAKTTTTTAATPKTESATVAAKPTTATPSTTPRTDTTASTNTAKAKAVEPATSTSGTSDTATPAATPTATPTPAATPDWSTKVINATTVLNAGDSVASNRMRITMRTSGDLVISDENGVVRWSSHTTGTGNRAVFQADGHFVVYSADDQTLWSSGTAGNDGAELVIQDDGNVTILSSGGAVLWSAGTQH